MNKDYNDFVERMTSFDLDLTAQEPGDINMRVSDSKPSLDNALAHYGVKGMKWGVRRQNKESLAKAKSRDQQRVASSAQRVARAEDRAADVFNKVRAENRAKGMGRIAAGRAANKDPRVKKADRDVEKADQPIDARKNEKQVKSQQKEARKDARSATLERAKAAYTTEKGSTRRLVNAVLTGGTSVGYNLQRSAGYSVGASLATTILAGPLANVAMAEYAARDGRAR